MAVTISSVLCHTDRQVSFYVLDGGISPSFREKIIGMVRSHMHADIEFLEIDRELFRKCPDPGRFSMNAYFRYLIPILKPEIRKALYIDSDMLVSGDAGALFDTPLEGKPFAAVPYLYERPRYSGTPLHRYGLQRKEILGLPPDHLYFNSGLLLLDCDYFRHNGLVEELFRLTNEAESLECPDQDILNVATAGNRYKALDDGYNVVVDINDALGALPRKIPFILHFTGGRRMRPWVSLDCPFRAEYDQCAALTPFASLLERQRLESELLFLKNALRAMMEGAVAERKSHVFRMFRWLTGCGRADKKMLDRLKGILSRFGSPAS